MKTTTIAITVAIAICSAFPFAHAETEETYEITAPQELSSYTDEWYFQIKWLMTGSGITIWKSHASSHPGKFLCLAPKKNEAPFTTQVIASFPWRTPILYGNIFEIREKSDIGERPWMSLVDWSLAGGQVSGKIFSYQANAQFGVPSECSYRGSSVPTAETDTVTYKIRFQFQPDTRVIFGKNLGGKKKWVLGSQRYTKSMSILYSGLPDYGTSSKWKASVVSVKTLDGTDMDISQSYANSIKISEGFEIPSDTEILTLTYTR